MIYPADCLAYHQNRALTRNRSLENVPCSVVAKAMTKFRSEHTDVFPEIEAIGFYQMAHAYALVQQRRHPLEPLPPAELELVAEYFRLGAIMAERAFYYLIIICQRETRHLKNKSEFQKPITELYGAPVYSYIKSLPDSPKEAMDKFESSPPKTTMGPYLKALAHVFYQGSWAGGYGGKKWGMVTDCAVRFVTGEFNAVLMIDTVWTLCHNNGPIFNKGCYYRHHSGNCLETILDVQRAGLIPALVKDPTTPMNKINHFMTPEINERNEKIYALFPDLETTVDYQKVQDLGATLSWVKGGKSHKAAPAKPMMKVPFGEKTLGAGFFELFPGMTIQKFQPKRAA